MKKYAFFTLAAAASLFVFSCAKENLAESSVEEAVVDPWTPVPLKEVPALPGSHTLQAGYENNTKSALNGAAVEWSAGDSFAMIGYDNKGYSTSTNYSTTSGGALASFTGGGTISYTENGLHCIYPSSSYGGLVYLGTILHAAVDIPSVQTATAGNVSPGALLSYAKASTQSDDLHFKNMLALIKFRLSGAVVSQVKKVSFKGLSNLAGDFFLSLQEATPAFETGYTSYTTTRTVTLTGDFVAGEDYYIAVAPGLQDGFTMVFENSDGSQYVKKVSSKKLTLTRSHVADFGVINLGDDFPAPDPAPTPYMTATAGATPVTMVVIPDGFTAGQLDEFELKAKSGIDALFNTEPYKTYKNYFQVWILKQASNESGANITDGSGNITTPRDCYFGSKWGEDSYDDMRANDSKVFAFVEDNCPDILDGSHKIEEVATLVLVNDTRYGGISWNWSDGKTYCLVPVGDETNKSWGYPSVEAASVTATPGAGGTRTVTDEEKAALGHSTGTWRNTLVHEFGGHSFGKLGDEYWYNSYYSAVAAIDRHGWSEPFALNISATYVAASTPWAELFESANVTAMEDKDATKYGRVGVFQGGQVSLFNRWRSEKISCMIDNRFYFSTWQRRLIVNRIMRLAGAAVPDFATFLASDVPDDPLRDSGGSSVMLPDGLVNRLPPKPVPMPAPPVLVD